MFAFCFLPSFQQTGSFTFLRRLLTQITAAICVKADCTCLSNGLKTDAVTVVTVAFRFDKSHFVCLIYAFAFSPPYILKKKEKKTCERHTEPSSSISKI